MDAEVRFGELRADFGKTAADYGRHRAGFRLHSTIDLRPSDPGTGMRTSTGTGTGTLARGLALRGCDSTGLDRSAPLMAEAARLDREAGVVVHYVEAAAEETGQADSDFDLVVAGQCWHWFNRNSAAREARRILKPGGHLAIAHFDWIPLPGNVADLTEKLIHQHNPKWTILGGVGMYPQWMAGLSGAGFRDLETFSFDLDVPYTHEAWRGRIRASAGVGASLTPEAVEAFDRELKDLLAEQFPNDPLAVLHRTFAVIATNP